ncbi:MAG TPA: prepilin-type N-terminal cleavage/methylation domain-containing protein [Chthoniobacterales bacterium]
MQSAAPAKSNDSRAFTLPKQRERCSAFALPRPRERFSAFTLVEMLVVIGIISLLLVAVIPAVNSLSKSNGSKAAISNFMNAVEQARSLAITSGSATYVVFADETLTSTETAAPDKYRAKSYIIFQDKNFVPTAVSKWYFLPTGISFLPGSGLMTAKDPTVKFACPGSLNNTPISLPFIKFDSEGAVALPANPAIMFVNFFSGFVSAGGQPTFTDSKQKTSQKFEQVTISSLTGRARYVDPYTTT